MVELHEFDDNLVANITEYSDNYYLIFNALFKSLMDADQKKKVFDKYPLALHDVATNNDILKLIKKGLGTKYFLKHKYVDITDKESPEVGDNLEYNFNSTQFKNDWKMHIYLSFCSEKNVRAIRDKFTDLSDKDKNYIHLILKEYDQADKTIDMKWCILPFESYEEYIYVTTTFTGKFTPKYYAPVFKGRTHDFFQTINSQGHTSNLKDVETFIENATPQQLLTFEFVRDRDHSQMQYLKPENMLKYCIQNESDDALVLYYALKYKDFVPSKIYSDNYFRNPKTNFFVDACRNRDDFTVRNIGIHSYKNIKIVIEPDDIDLIHWLYEMKLNVNVIINEHLYELNF